MSSADIDRLASQFNRSMSIKGKTPIITSRSTFNFIKKDIHGKKKSQIKRHLKRQMREEKQEKKEQRMKAMLKRLKEVKVRYDTRRIASISTEADERLNNLHYANFLGDKYGNNKAPYNSNAYVNLKFCDAMREEEANDEQTYTHECNLSDDMSELSLGSGEYDEDVNQNLEWVEVLVKRQHASYLEAMKAIEDEENDIQWEEDDEPPLKRARLDLHL